MNSLSDLKDWCLDNSITVTAFDGKSLTLKTKTVILLPEGFVVNNTLITNVKILKELLYDEV